MANIPTATCGAKFEHEWHSFTGKDGKRYVCDGVLK